MQAVLTLVLAVVSLPVAHTDGNDFGFTGFDDSATFDVGGDLSDVVLNFDSILKDSNSHRGVAGIDFSALDAQIESLADDDLSSILEELKGYHDLTDDGKMPHLFVVGQSCCLSACM